MKTLSIILLLIVILNIQVAWLEVFAARFLEMGNYVLANAQYKELIDTCVIAGRREEANQILDRASRFFEEKADDFDLQKRYFYAAEYYSSAANYYKQLSNRDKALRCYSKASDNYKEIGETIKSDQMQSLIKEWY